MAARWDWPGHNDNGARIQGVRLDLQAFRQSVHGEDRQGGRESLRAEGLSGTVGGPLGLPERHRGRVRSGSGPVFGFNEAVRYDETRGGARDHRPERYDCAPRRQALPSPPRVSDRHRLPGIRGASAVGR